jgi:hypothetical protein
MPWLDEPFIPGPHASFQRHNVHSGATRDVLRTILFIPASHALFQRRTRHGG